MNEILNVTGVLLHEPIPLILSKSNLPIFFGFVGVSCEKGIDVFLVRIHFESARDFVKTQKVAPASLQCHTTSSGIPWLEPPPMEGE